MPPFQTDQVGMIGIFCAPQDADAHRLAELLNRQQPDSARCFDVTLAGRETIAIDREGVFWDGLTLTTSLSVAFLRGVAYQDPVIPHSDDRLDWSLWQSGYLIDQQKFSILSSLFQELERRGVPVISSSKLHLENFSKQILLQKLRAAGCSVPKMLVTNDLEAVDAFRQEIGGELLWRPTSGRAAWQPFRAKQQQVLIAPEKPPVLLAEKREGELFRGYFFRGEPLLFLKYRAPGYYPRETMESFQRVDASRVFFNAAPLAVAGISWAQVLFLQNQEREEAWLYDVDPDPIVDPLPLPDQTFLLEALANALLNGGDRGDRQIASGSDTVRDRPTLFLRRMLQILFEFERSKNAPQP